jgi:hypothetical protein
MKPENDIQTFRRIRRAIGYLGISLPLALLALSCVPYFNTPVQPSISDYYYTHFREVFTGILCATGLFLIRYVGYKSSKFWENDNLLSNIAGYMALGIAFFPTSPKYSAEKIYSFIPVDKPFLGWIHYGFAAAFFVILAILSIRVFTIGQKPHQGIRKSLVDENNLYKICGYLILFFVAMVPVFSILHVFRCSTLLFETLALFAFGISWLIKGRALGDKGMIGKRIYRESH